jgi:hypothetical protein
MGQPEPSVTVPGSSRSTAPTLFGFSLHCRRVRIFDLHPMRRAPRAVGRAKPLGYNNPRTRACGRMRSQDARNHLLPRFHRVLQRRRLLVRTTKPATGSPQIKRSKSRTFVLERAEKGRKFKGSYPCDLVRDEGVAGSNPATPTNTTNTLIQSLATRSASCGALSVSRRLQKAFGSLRWIKLGPAF